MSSDTGGVTVESVVVGVVGTVVRLGLGLGGPLSTTSVTSRLEAVPVSGRPVLLVRVTVISTPVIAGLGSSHGSQSGQLQENWAQFYAMSSR